jgi:hypothetical protein
VHQISARGDVSRLFLRRELDENASTEIFTSRVSSQANRFDLADAVEEGSDRIHRRVPRERARKNVSLIELNHHRLTVLKHTFIRRKIGLLPIDHQRFSLHPRSVFARLHDV